jgi:nicotinamidase-related amidase
VKDALVLIDVINVFEHEDGERLLASFRERLPGPVRLLQEARGRELPVLSVNDAGDHWDSDAPRLVRRAEAGHGGDVIRTIAPQPGDRVILKPRYSAFDHTPLVLLLRELAIERLLLAGGATERCLVQSAIDARELGFKVTIVADACAAVDQELERLSFAYARRVVGALVERVEELRL